ncbi:MAG: DinB family protein [Flavobacteriales bacterium]|nr:DinB family protein [Flavobacteriales bacterium]
MDKEAIIHQYDFNLAYARELIFDVSDEQMTVIPAIGLENHPAFTLGHLVAGSADLNRDLGGEFSIPEGWDALFVRVGPGDPRLPNLDRDYPSKVELLEELHRQHERVKNHLRLASENELAQPITWRFSTYMPTLGEVVMFMCVNHEAMHLGQLAAWRRAMGFNSALARVKHNSRPYH